MSIIVLKVPKNVKVFCPAFLAKVIEKVVAAQTHSYLENNLLMPSMQSAYHNNHSTETALLRVRNDVLRSVDRRQDVVLVMLDLSAGLWIDSEVTSVIPT